MYPHLVLPNLWMLNSPQIVLITVNEDSRKQISVARYFIPVLFLPRLFEFCSAPAQSKSTLTSWMALGRVNFIIGTNIKSKQFTRCATCVRICGEINKLLLLDHWSLNALLIWEENQRGFGNGVCVCMHAHSRENEEKCGETEKIAQQSSIPSPQKGEIKSRIISRCQLPPGWEMGSEPLKGEVREKVHLHLQKPFFFGKTKNQNAQHSNCAQNNAWSKCPEPRQQKSPMYFAFMKWED